MENVQRKFNNIPSYIKWNDDIDNPRFIPDGMNEIERSVKRAGDFVLSAISLLMFSPLFLICYIAVKKRMVDLPSSNKNASEDLENHFTFINSAA